jgi:predicted ATP-binding protein involved in virulence
MSGIGDWHVDSLTLENFRCFDSVTIDLDPEMTVFVGVNGAGKTAVLDGIAIMLSTVLREFDGQTRGFARQDAREIPVDLGSRDSVAHMRTLSPTSARMDGTLGGKSFWWRRERSGLNGRTTWGEKNTEVGRHVAGIWERSQSAEDTGGTVLPVIAHYGVERLVGVRKAFGSIAASRSGAYDSALDGKSDLARLSTFIEALTLADFAGQEVADGSGLAAREQLRTIQHACDLILEGTGWGRLAWNPLVRELTLTHPNSGMLPLSMLSAGIKIIAGVVIDLASRMARDNPSYGGEELLRRVPGIVLIDEVDLHLHPRWQQKILTQLRAAFPLVQFIVTTHSPQVLSTVPAAQIRLIDDAGVRRVPYSQGLRSDIVLDRVLGTDPEPSLEINEDLERYLELVNRGEGRSIEAVQLRNKLDEAWGGVANVPKLADADARIAFYDLEL